MTDFKFSTFPELSLEQLELLRQIWNAEYPSSISYSSVNEFQDYLLQLEDLNHVLIYQADRIIGWYFDFIREKSRWFGMLLNSDFQNKGLGTHLLSVAKQKHDQLTGWMIDSHSLLKPDKSLYKSPLDFYKKNNFSVDSKSRFESDQLSTVKIYWKK